MVTRAQGCKVVPGLYWHTRGKNLPCVQKRCVVKVSNVSLDTQVMHLILQLVIITPYIFYTLKSSSDSGSYVGYSGEQRQQLISAPALHTASACDGCARR